MRKYFTYEVKLTMTVTVAAESEFDAFKKIKNDLYDKVIVTAPDMHIKLHVDANEIGEPLQIEP